MAVRFIKNRWYIDITFDGRRCRKPCPENSRAAALAYEASLRRKLARGETIDDTSDTKPKSQTFEQFAWNWFEVYSVPNNKYSEQKTKRSTLNCSLIPFFGKMLVDEIKEFQIEQFKAASIKQGY